jgi:hypothetical protein
MATAVPITFQKALRFYTIMKTAGEKRVIIALYNGLGSYVISTDNYTVTGRDSLYKF